MIEYVYALLAEDVIFYVGRTCNPQTRLARHLNDGAPDGTLKEQVIYGLLQDGVKITMKILESGPADKMQGKEELYRVNLKSQGHPLTNTRSGDSPLLDFALTPAKPWSIDLFHGAQWEKDDPKARKGEWAAWIRGVLFLRTGQSKLRMWHPDFEYWDIKAFPDMEARYVKAIAMLTPGTLEREQFLDDVANWKRLKG
jgi:hypothetical protein